MTRISKPPEERKQELIDIALDLFLAKGYEAVSVRDILKVVNGHPGMFYYYFSSKQEIYNEAIRQLIAKETHKKRLIIEDRSKPLSRRFKELLESIIGSIHRAEKMLNDPDSIPYETVVILDMLTALADPVASLIMEAKEEGYIPESSGLNEDNALEYALFLNHGMHGILQFKYRHDVSEVKEDLIITFVARLFKISESAMKELLA